MAKGLSALVGFARVSLDAHWPAPTTVNPVADTPGAEGEYAAACPTAAGPDDYRLDGARLRALTRIDARWSMGHIAWEWICILACAWLCERYFSWPIWLLACVCIGSRLHALGIMAHDGTHGLLFRNRRLNDLVVELLLAWPVFLSLPAYRQMHKQHHRLLNTAEDPDWARNRPDRLATSRGWLEFLRIMGGINGEQRQLLRFVGANSPAEKPMVPRLLIFAVVVGAAVATGSLALVGKYWLAPFFSWFLLSMRLKGTAEHFAVENTEACNAARTLRPGIFARLLIAPKNVHFHIEHHLYPSVPFYRLPALHAALMEMPGFRERAHLTSSYPQYLLECLRTAKAGDHKGGPRLRPVP